MAYKLKQTTEDFVVEEIPDYQVSDSGKYCVYQMKKRGYTTVDAVQYIATKLNILPKYINYAGLKDRNAITLQFISIFTTKKLEKEYDFGEVKLKLRGYRDERLFPGCLRENKFEIVVRNLEDGFRIKHISRIVNYFGEQRFSKQNAEIGKKILQGDYNQAAEMISAAEGIAMHKDFLMTVKRSKMLRMYLNAYQSLLWNKCVDEYLGKSSVNAVENVEMPIIGFGIEIKNNVKAIVDKVLADEGLNTRSFVLKKMPEMSLEGNNRLIFVDLIDLKIGELEVDELNKGMKKCRVSFTLPKGSYATESIRQMFSE